MIYGISIILLSIIAVPSLILSKKPNAQELLDKIAPYQGWIGLVFCFWGVWGLISSILNIGWLSSVPIWWTTFMVGSLLQAILGFMLGLGMINKLLLSNNEEAKEKAQALSAKIAPKLGTVGIVGIGFGCWMIAASFIYHM